MQTYPLFIRGSDLENKIGNLNSKNTIQLDYWYPGYSQKQRTGQIFLCCFSLILPLGSEKAHDIQTSESKKATTRLRGNLPHPCVLLP